MALDFARINREVSLIRLANERYHLGWPDIGRAAQIRCPMHDDSTPSARYYSDERGGYCWTCQSGIDPVGLVAVQEGVGRGQAARLLMDWYGIPDEPDVEADAVWELLRLAQGGEQPLTEREEEGLRRAAGVAIRMVGRPWTPELLTWWDHLDLDQPDPREWLAIVRGSLAL